MADTTAPASSSSIAPASTTGGECTATASAAARVVQKATKLPRRNNYFLVDDIVWCKPERLPFWPAEIVKEEKNSSVFTCRLFYPPEGTPIDMKSTSVKLYYFDKLRSEAELAECVEGRLQRDKHKVEAYEANFVKAVRRANDLVRITMSPLKLAPFEVCGVGVVHSLMRSHVAAPRQPSTGKFDAQPAVIMMRPGLENAVRDLKGFDYVWVLFHFSYACLGDEANGITSSSSAGETATTDAEGKNNKSGGKKGASTVPDLPQGWKTMVIPPRDTKLRGVFATRSPHRPNSIGMSCVRLVDVQGLEVHIADHDLLHGTPVLDIKPYLPFCEAHPNARAGWVTELDEAGLGGADHRGSAGPAIHRNYDDQKPATKHE